MPCVEHCRSGNPSASFLHSHSARRTSCYAQHTLAAVNAKNVLLLQLPLQHDWWRDASSMLAASEPGAYLEMEVWGGGLGRQVAGWNVGVNGMQALAIGEGEKRV